MHHGAADQDGEKRIPSQPFPRNQAGASAQCAIVPTSMVAAPLLSVQVDTAVRLLKNRLRAPESASYPPKGP